MHELLNRVLLARGLSEERARNDFLNPDYDAHLHDPLLLPDITAATKRIKQAIDKGQKIAVYGDYDIDGLSATALLLDALSSMGAEATAYIPDRFEEGYGINTEALLQLKAQKVELVITVDCGSLSFKPIATAKKAGLDVIVTDHHEVGKRLPAALAIINPKRADSNYPFTGLAGVGVAFKLVQALQFRYGLLPPGREKWLLDLVALGTVCDVVDLVDENRVLVTYGLKVFAKTSRVGLRAMAQLADIDLSAVSTYHFGFVIGPRLNAAGRLEHAKRALELLTTTDKIEAEAAAVYLNSLNDERYRQQQNIVSAATMQAERYLNDPVLVLSGADWNHGIVGIVAAKIMERFHKPTLVLQEMGVVAKGSARSLGGFSMVEALQESDSLLDKYGGHHVAAGCSLATANIAKLRDNLNSYYRDKGFGQLYSPPQADVELPDLSLVDMTAYRELQRLRPFGMGNSAPLFFIAQAKITDSRYVGADRRHLKLSVTDGRQQFEAIGFGLGEPRQLPKNTADIWFEIDNNTYRQRSSLQLKIKELAYES